MQTQLDVILLRQGCDRTSSARRPNDSHRSSPVHSQHILRWGFAVAGRGGHRVDVPAGAPRDARPFQESGNAKSTHKEHAHEAGSSSHVSA